MATDTNQLDPNRIVFDITYEASGTETVAFDSGMRKEVRYWLERNHGPAFTSTDVVNELNEWAESHLDAPFGDYDFWDFDWSIQGINPREQEAWLFGLFRDTPYAPPEIQGQSRFELSPDSNLTI